jgi:hypothetical protein
MATGECGSVFNAMIASSMRDLPRNACAHPGRRRSVESTMMVFEPPRVVRARSAHSDGPTRVRPTELRRDTLED